MSKRKQMEEQPDPRVDDVLLDDQYEQHLERSYEEEGGPLPLNPLDEFNPVHNQPQCRLEKKMDMLLRAIRNKPDWQRKLSDESIVAKWKEEVKTQHEIEKEQSLKNNWFRLNWSDCQITEKAFDYVVKEAAWLASLELDGMCPSIVEVSSMR